MTTTTTTPGTLPPEASMTYPQKLKALRNYHTGSETIRDPGGRVAGITLGPSWLIPPIVMTTSPTGAHDVLANNDGSFDKETIGFQQFRLAFGDDLFSRAHDR